MPLETCRSSKLSDQDLDDCKCGEPLWFDPAMVLAELLVIVLRQEAGGLDNQMRRIKTKL